MKEFLAFLDLETFFHALLPKLSVIQLDNSLTKSKKKYPIYNIRYNTYIYRRMPPGIDNCGIVMELPNACPAASLSL